MAYQIVMDSCGDMTEEMKRDERITLVPLRLHIGGKEYIDDGTLERREVLSAIEHSEDVPRSSCPSPTEYQEKMTSGYERTYLITLSEHLSGSYNSACLAHRQMPKDRQKTVFVINSHSASAGETLLAQLIQDWEENEIAFDEICKMLIQRVEMIKTRFVLEDLTMLERNGRLNGLKAKIAGVLHICPVLAGTPQGTICQTGQARGMKRGIVKLFHQILEDSKEQQWERMVISHCCNEEMAIELKTKIRNVFPERAVRIAATGGVSSLYAGRGGIIVSYV